jgi:predicted transcriptional regulator
MNDLVDLRIENATPHILRRPILYVEPNTRMLQVATFLAMGPEIYVDGLWVIDDKVQRGKPIGRISSRRIISCILDCGYPDCMQKKASQMIDGLVMPLEMDSPLRKALEVFKTTGFAFVPVLAKSDVGEDPSLGIAASLAIRDVLPLIAKAKLTIPVKEFASQLLSVSGKSSIRNTLDIMLSKGIRNIGISGEYPYRFNGLTKGGDEKGKEEKKVCRIINDRKILEFLLSHNGREVASRKEIARLEDINIIENLDTTYLTAVKFDTSVSRAAALLMDVHNPFLIYESNQKESKKLYIITPWDIVMKLLTPHHVTGIT